MPNTEKLNIHQKLLKIADAAGVLQKTKDGYGYRYVPEEEVQAKVTANMQKLGVMLYVEITPGTLKVVPYTYEKYDKKEKKLVPVNEVIVSADTIYTWVDTENPADKVVVPWGFVGQMEDASFAMGGGLTYSNRYFLMKALQLATTEDDPDSYRTKQKEAESYEETKIAKAAAEELEKAVKEVVTKGSALMSAGHKKEEIMAIVGKHNNGNQNPSSIKTLDICAAVMKDFKALEKPAKAPEKPTEEKKPKTINTKGATIK